MSSEATYEFIDITKQPTKFDLAAWIVLTRRRYGTGYLSQYFDIKRLKDGLGRLSTGEYYIYQLFDQERFDLQAQEEFLGHKRKVEIYNNVNDRKWLPVEACKIKTAQLVAEHGIRVPQDFALYHPSQEVDGIPTLTSREQLADFLRNGITFPFFSKPLRGSISLGVAAIQGYDRESDLLLLKGGKGVKVDKFVEAVSNFYEKGYLFQEQLQPHPEVKRIIGDRLPSVRAVMLYDNEETEPEMLRTIWKIPVGNNVADNAWRDGNLLAGIDPETGLVTRVIDGWGPDEGEIERHPDTKEMIKGVLLPEWDKFKALCQDCAKAFAGMQLQAWDITITPEGPVMLEINGAGDFSIPQRATAQGLMTGRLREFYKRYEQDT